jgi:hypothetical protein
MLRAMKPSLRTYVLLNRLWFFGFVVLVLGLASAGVDVVPVIVIALAFAGFSFAVFAPRRPWWGADVRAAMADRQTVRRWAKQDLIAFVILLVAVPVMVGIFTALQQP